MFKELKVGAVIPAYNEALAIGQVVKKMINLKHQGVRVFDDIVVCDNGSTDKTAYYARLAGARVTQETLKGYGNACLAGLAFLESVDAVVFVDGDDSIVPLDILLLLQKITEGYSLVLGARVPHLAEKGALLLHQKLGNKLIVSLIQLMWGQRYQDLSPLRVISTSALNLLKMQDQTFGWTLEMQIKAILHHLKTCEVPIHYQKRIGKSKISGNVRGSLKATHKMLQMLFMQYWQSLRARKLKSL